jgi:hypothetical protein
MDFAPQEEPSQRAVTSRSAALDAGLAWRAPDDGGEPKSIDDARCARAKTL